MFQNDAAEGAGGVEVRPAERAFFQSAGKSPLLRRSNFWRSSSGAA
jgi:hypothetical protein